MDVTVQLLLFHCYMKYQVFKLLILWLSLITLSSFRWFLNACLKGRKSSYFFDFNVVFHPPSLVFHEGYMCSLATDHSLELSSVTAEAREMDGKRVSVIPAGIPYTVAKLGSELYRTARGRIQFCCVINNRQWRNKKRRTSTLSCATFIIFEPLIISSQNNGIR